ncbi:hypothetical protein FRC02_006225 [Tulasnella sp. 418]|nr:hypothetical protein FRC02_006225 [Tulasnella sp. 418]
MRILSYLCIFPLLLISDALYDWKSHFKAADLLPSSPHVRVSFLLPFRTLGASLFVDPYLLIFIQTSHHSFRHQGRELEGLVSAMRWKHCMVQTPAPQNTMAAQSESYSTTHRDRLEYSLHSHNAIS